MKFVNCSPILFVDKIEPCLGFWKELLGFQQVTEVADEQGAYIFVLLMREGVSVMYQTKASAREDLKTLNEEIDLNTSLCLYINVDNIEEAEQALAGLPRFQEKRETFYGALEFGVREPSGNPVIFAQQQQPAAD